MPADQMSNREPNEDLLRLLTDAADGTLTADDNARLEQMLRDNPQARADYLDCMALHATLSWNAADLLEQIAPAPLVGASAETAVTTRGRRATLPWKTLAWATTSLSAALTLLVAFVLSSGGKPVLLPITVAPPNSTPSLYVANLTGDSNVVWASPQSQPHPRARLLAGQWLEFESGLVEVTFADGAVALVEGPARFQINDANSARLAQGKVTADVPKSATGFKVTTPMAEIVDLGTRFGVSVGEGTTQAHVFKGEIKAQPVDRPGRGDSFVHLAEGEAASFGADGGDVVRTKAQAEQFAGKLPHRIGSVAIADLAASSRNLIKPVSVRSNLPIYSHPLSRLIDGSGLVGSGPLLSRIHLGNADNSVTDDSHNWKTAASYLPIDLDFDLGEPCDLTRLHIWNYSHPAPGVFASSRDARHIDLSVSEDGSEFRPVGSIELSSSADVSETVQSFPLLGRAQYVRLRVTSIYSVGHGAEVGLGEVRFEATRCGSAVVEPDAG